MKVVVYVSAEGGLWKDIPAKINQKVSEDWINALLLLDRIIRS